MLKSNRGITVAVLNTSIEFTRIMETALELEGFIPISKYIVDFKNGTLNIDRFIQKTKPDAIIFDIAIPYEENYNFLKKLQKKKSIKNIPIILTTTNKRVVEELVGEKNLFEIVGKPFDLQEIIDAICNSVDLELRKEKPCQSGMQQISQI